MLHVAHFVFHHQIKNNKNKSINEDKALIISKLQRQKNETMMIKAFKMGASLEAILRWRAVLLGVLLLTTSYITLVHLLQRSLKTTQPEKGNVNCDINVEEFLCW